MENYGETIAALRKEKGMTQRELGQALNVTYQAVSKWENEQSQPPVDTFFAICKFFGITTDEFMRRAAGESAEPKTPCEEPVEEQRDEGKAESEQAALPPVEAQLTPPADVSAQSTPAPSVQAQKAPVPDAFSAPVRAKKLSVGFLIVMILAIVAGLGPFISLMIILQINSFLPALFPFFLGYFVFSFIILIGHESVVWDVFLGALFKSVNVPGVIFTLDINGILFLIVYKFIIAPLITAVVWIVFVLGGFILSFFMSGFVFPFRIPTIYRETFGGKVPKKKEFQPIKKQ